MKKLVLDTSVLLNWWNRCRSELGAEPTTRDVKTWARQLIAQYGSNTIVTPVYIEVVAGTLSRKSLQLNQAYLAEFKCVDEQRITPEDWREAIRRAQRVPAKKKRPRDLGDCLIRAIADRLYYEVKSLDKGFA